jgi:hypothetical protein
MEERTPKERAVIVRGHSLGSKGCTHPVGDAAGSEVKHDAGGNALLVLKAGDKMRSHVVDLNEPDPDERKHLEVHAASQSDGKGVARMRREKEGGRPSAGGFMHSTHENVHKGGNARGEGDLRAKQVGVPVRALATQVAPERAVIAAKIRDNGQVLDGLVHEAAFPSVQGGMVGEGCCRAWRAGAKKRSRLAHRSPQVRVAAEHLEFVLRAQRSGKEQNER